MKVIGIVLEIATISTGPPKPDNKRASDEAADMSPLPEPGDWG
jgi:hypothetical protein